MCTFIAAYFGTSGQSSPYPLFVVANILKQSMSFGKQRPASELVAGYAEILYPNCINKAADSNAFGISHPFNERGFLLFEAKFYLLIIYFIVL